MDFIALGRSLADLGGFALSLVIVVVAAVGLYRQWWVPGWIYRRLDDRLAAKEAESRRQVITIARLTRQLERERLGRRTDGR